MRAFAFGWRRRLPAPPALPVAVPAAAGGRAVPLGGDACLRIVRGAGSVVACEAGELWVTRDGSWQDIVLAPGQAVRIVDAAPVLVSGFGPSLARVSAPLRRGALGALALGWRGLADRLLGRLAPADLTGRAGARG